MYACMYVCTYVCMYVCICTYVHICICTHTYTYVYIYTHIHTCMHVYTSNPLSYHLQLPNTDADANSKFGSICAEGCIYLYSQTCIHANFKPTVLISTYFNAPGLNSQSRSLRAFLCLLLERKKSAMARV